MPNAKSYINIEIDANIDKDKYDTLKTFLNTGPMTDDVYESIINARREDAEYAAVHANDREPML